SIPVLDLHELAAGKLAALLSRRQARDLFDCHRILNMDDLERDRLRIAFVVYGGMNRRDWRTLSIEDVDFDPAELTSLLIPTLDTRAIQEQGSPAEFGARLVRECREGLGVVLPFNDAEREFLDLLLDKGEIDSTILTADESSQRSEIQKIVLKRIILDLHILCPALQWHPFGTRLRLAFRLLRKP
ncbi:MAG: nucleotidyl transferase AbiEii/AbiGii toxin family protein, partial [Deltaproteobacteria bacterium]|nr:nucleotidyl transferase AbiEii/AbiGii toxin family protein [Deltaproteobacteria bacterium]